MRKGGYYVNNTLLRASGQVNGWTSEQANSKERQSNKGTSGQVNEWTGYLWRVRDNMRTRFPLYR